MGAPGQTPHRHRRRRSRCAAASEPGPRLDDMAVDRIDAAALYPTFGLMIQGVTERGARARAVPRAERLGGRVLRARPRAPHRRRHAADDRAPSDALAEARARASRSSASAACGAGPSTSTRSPASTTRRTSRCGRTWKTPTCRSPSTPGMSGLVPYDELQSRFDDYYTPLHAAHFVTEQMLAPHHVRRVRDPRAPPAPAGRVPRDRRGVGDVVRAPPRRALELFGFDRGALTAKPSEYFRRQCFVSVEEVEPGLPTMLARVPRLGGVLVRLPARRRHVPRLHQGPAREPTELDDDAAPPRAARQRAPPVRTRP